MKERPMIFSDPMIRAILEGRKTMTRRVVKPQPAGDTVTWGCTTAHPGFGFLFGKEKEWRNCPYGEPGDRLWIKESLRGDGQPGNMRPGIMRYVADGAAVSGPLGEAFWRYKRPLLTARYMPRWASRLTLEVAGVRVERVQDITEEDAIAEGAFAQGKCGDDPVSDLWTMTGEGWRYNWAQEAFRTYWDSLNDKRPGASWEENPWVWVVEFKRVEVE
jgi:hypothetical protein